MIQALVNGVWKYFSEDELQPGTGSFKLNNGLYETFRTRDFKPILLKPSNLFILLIEKPYIFLYFLHVKIFFKLIYFKTGVQKCLKILIKKIL